MGKRSDITLSEKQQRLVSNAKTLSEILQKRGITSKDETEEYEGSRSLMFSPAPKSDSVRNPGEVLEENLSRLSKEKTARELIAESVVKNHPGLTVEEALEMMSAFGF